MYQTTKETNSKHGQVGVLNLTKHLLLIVQEKSKLKMKIIKEINKLLLSQE